MLLIFSLVIVLLLILNIVLAYWNVSKHNEYGIKILNQRQKNSKTLPYKRGDITDRNGNILATSVKVYNLILDPKVIQSNDGRYLEQTRSALLKCFPELTDTLDKTLQDKKDSQYVIAKKALSYEEVKPFMDIQNNTKDYPYVKGVWFETEYQRNYPYKTLACSVIGFANASNQADLGIENYYNSDLNGIDGREYGYVDEDSNLQDVTKDPVNGNNIVSTLDIKIQSIVEKHIADYQKQIQSKGISVVVANPNNGEILAMATNKTFDLNNPRDLSSVYSKKKLSKMSDKEKTKALNELWKNSCVTNTYEPGSTMKPFTVSMALEEKKVGTKDEFLCDGHQKVDNVDVGCNDVHGNVTMKQAITYSCNDALMQIGLKIGKDKFSEYQQRFGFGQKTGIDLPSEAAGQLHSGSQMSNLDLACNAFGQNFTVNMLQIEAGFCSLVNGGNYYTPHVVSTVKNEKGGLVRTVESNVTKQTVTSTTSSYIKDALRSVVTEGTGKKAAISGYDIGGKTGTAEKLPRGNNEYVLSFIGCVPCNKPEVVCYVVIDTPKDDPEDSGYAAQLFSNIMKEVLPYMNIYKSSNN